MEISIRELRRAFRRQVLLEKEVSDSVFPVWLHFGLTKEEWYMADKSLVDVPSKRVVGAAELERYKMERTAEIEFLDSLVQALSVLSTKVGPQNRVRASMARFLRNQGY